MRMVIRFAKVLFRERLGYKIDSVFRENDGLFHFIQPKMQNEPFIPAIYYAPNEEGAQTRVLSRSNDIIQNLETREDTTTILICFLMFTLVQMEVHQNSS